MKALVLGGSGFIGSHLVECLVRNRFKVLVYDRVLNPLFAEQRDVECVIDDFTSEFRMLEMLSGVDVVFHCISSTVPSSSMLNPIADIESNLVGTVRLLETMRKSGTRRIVYLSSGGTVYGVPEHVPVTEKHSLRPVSSYGVVKVAVEHYLQMYEHLYDFKPLIVRISNAYGPRQGKMGIQGAIGTFLNKMAEGSSITIWGNGETVRDYIFVDDLVDFCVRAALTETSGVFNCGSGTGHSLNELLAIMQHVTGLLPDVGYEDQRNFDIPKIVLDCTRAQEVFSWKSQTNIRTGIERHWEWLKGTLDSAKI